MDASNPAQRFSLHSRSQGVNTGSSNPSPQRTQDSASGPSISLRLGQLFRSNRHRNLNLGSNPSNQNTNSDSNSSNSQSNETPTSASTTSSTATAGADQGNTSNSSPDFFEIIQLEPSSLERASFGPGNRTSLRLPSSQRLRREG